MKNTFAERLQQAMDAEQISQAELAIKVGVSQPAINRLLTGKTNTSRRIIEIAKALKVQPEWLLSGVGDMRNLEGGIRKNEESIPPVSEWKSVDVWDSDTPLDDDEVEVPFLKDIELAAGDGSFCDEDYNGYKIRFSKATLRRVGAMKENVICFPARGNSMEPVIPDGTTVAIDCANKTIIDGKLYAIATDGMKRIKQLYRRPGGVVVIRSYNRDEYADENVNERDLEIMGRVFWYSVLL
ncbi:repressor protein CI [Yersinia similis]|uniref:Repressor protein CI n=1 Tax=Yersinia similis TaxID=367190 RepID=A0A0T9QKM6_9GAMM|nr:helix-turn-helix transcriptional regulator [Yersinia similis]CNI16492.1 repressor protein CI [Yersinia similis]